MINIHKIFTDDTVEVDKSNATEGIEILPSIYASEDKEDEDDKCTHCIHKGCRKGR